MKASIHPAYKATKFTCACGFVLETFSNLGGDRHIEICANCHPFFKGSQRDRMNDAAGRIEKFKRRYSQEAKKQEAIKEDKKKAPVAKGGKAKKSA